MCDEGKLIYNHLYQLICMTALKEVILLKTEFQYFGVSYRSASNAVRRGPLFKYSLRKEPTLSKVLVLISALIELITSLLEFFFLGVFCIL